eukprot:Skav225882  [mRNA]  locus=scaffold2702:39687:49558:- [translate_table: standard]
MTEGMQGAVELTPDEPCCCLAWAIAKESADAVRGQLSSLHAEIQKQARFFEASSLVWDTTSGVLVGRSASRDKTTADSMARMGQLLCRWALSQSPPMSLYVGLDVLDEEPSSESGVRKRLRENEERNLSKEIREGRAEGRTSMSLEAFRELLVEHKVELSKFGTGGFKSLEQFYKEVMAEEYHLLVLGGSLRRLLETIRISLRFRSSSGKLKELRMQPEKELALVMQPSANGDWQETVENRFKTEFGLSAELQKLCFAMDHQAYSFEEMEADDPTLPIPSLHRKHSRTSAEPPNHHLRRREVEYSRSFPGLKTLYDILEVTCEVCHPHDQRWSVIGLPGANDFTYLRKNEVAGQTEAVVTRWGWDVPTGESYVLQPPSLFDKKDRCREGGDTQVEAIQAWSPCWVFLMQVLPPILPKGGDSMGELLASRVMEGKVTDWSRARRAAEMIREPSYSTKDGAHGLGTRHG